MDTDQRRSRQTPHMKYGEVIGVTNEVIRRSVVSLNLFEQFDVLRTLVPHNDVPSWSNDL